MVLLGIVIIIGVSMFMWRILIKNGILDMALAVVLVYGIMYIGYMFYKPEITIPILSVIAVIGVILFMLPEKNINRIDFFSPAFVISILFFLIFLILFNNDFMQHFDDLHEWAISVRYMLEKGHLPNAIDYTGTGLNFPRGTSMILVFFEKIGGYNEGHMYAINQFIVSIGISMALSNYKWKDIKKVIFFVAIILFSFNVLYLYPYKSLYVDLPLATWAAGFCVLWYKNRFENKLRMTVCTVVIFLYITQIKWGVGPLFVVFILLYMVLVHISDVGFEKIKGKLIKFIVIGAAAGLIIFMMAFVIKKTTGFNFIPLSLDGIIDSITFRTQKARLTALGLTKSLFMKSLNGITWMKLCFGVIFPLFVLLLFNLKRQFINKKNKEAVNVINYNIIYLILTTIIYIGVLYVTYVSTFSYEESIKAASSMRYLGIYSVFIFIILISMVFRLWNNYRYAFVKATLIVVLLICMCSVNRRFISQISSYDETSIKGYNSLTKGKDDIKKLGEITNNELTYFLAQKYSLERYDEYYMASLMFNSNDSLGSYVRLPWKYYEDGSYVFIKSSKLTINDLPDILKDKKFKYIWVSSLDRFLNSYGKEMFGINRFLKGGVYKINYNSNGDIKLELKGLVR